MGSRSTRGYHTDGPVAGALPMFRHSAAGPRVGLSLGTLHSIIAGSAERRPDSDSDAGPTGGPWGIGQSATARPDRIGPA